MVNSCHTPDNFFYFFPMQIITQLIVNGLIAGALYALIASGFSLVYRVLKFLHFAHGALVMVGGYFFYFFSVILDLNIIISFLLSIVSTSIIGVLTDFIIYKRLRKKNATELIQLLASFAV